MKKRLERYICWLIHREVVEMFGFTANSPTRGYPETYVREAISSVENASL